MKTQAMVGLVMLTSAVASAADAPREVHGRVVDERGRPVAGADVTTFWSANGLPWVEVAKIAEKDWEKALGREGQMAPWGDAPTASGAEGRFTIRVKYPTLPLIAIDSERRRGGMVMSDANDPSPALVITLVPLIRVTGSFRAMDGSGPPERTTARVNLAEDRRFPLALRGVAWCHPLQGRFEFRLPPGRYVLRGNTPYDLSPRLSVAREVAFTLDPDREELNLGTLELSPTRNFLTLKDEAQARGTFGDFRKHYGRRPPPWFVADAKGVARDVRIDDFRGKWILLYFWGMGCRPCLQDSLPEMVAFYEAHRSQRDKFEVLAFCLDVDGEFKGVADLDRALQPVIRNAWGSKPLPFPILLDNTFRTVESFGLSGLGDKLLIDPGGNLVEGDEKTLAEKLRR